MLTAQISEILFLLALAGRGSAFLKRLLSQNFCLNNN